LEESLHSLRRKQQASDDNRQLKLQKQAEKKSGDRQKLQLLQKNSSTDKASPVLLLPSFLPLVRVAAQKQQASLFGRWL
jgi:hypothetical protein